MDKVATPLTRSATNVVDNTFEEKENTLEIACHHPFPGRIRLKELEKNENMKSLKSLSRARFGVPKLRGRSPQKLMND